MKSSAKLIPITVLILLLYSCGSTNHFYKNSDGLSQSFDDSNIDFELFMVGDLGLESNTLGPDELITRIKAVMRPDFKDQAVVFVGNSMAISGLPDEETASFKMTSKAISHCLGLLAQKTDKVFFTPGRTEWSNGTSINIDNLHATEHFLEEVVTDRDIMRPSGGCGDPEVIELTDDLILVLVDSQWMLESDNSDQGSKSGCGISNNVEFIAAMNDIVASNKSKNIVVASHHPIYANGKVGGNYPVANHLLPLPVLGSLITGVRKIMGGPQQFGHPDYEAYRAAYLGGIRNCAGCITVSGHDNSLQYHERGENHFLVAGSGSKVNYVRKGDGATFSSMTQGFTKIVHTKDFELWLEIYGLNETTRELELLYRKLMHKKVIEDYNDDTIYQPKSAYSETKKVVASEWYGKKKFLRGNFYRDAWKEEVEVPVLWLDEAHGGLKPIQQGGGYQTRSLRLENPDGVQYVLRSVNKDVEKVVPSALRKTFVKNVVQDGIAASHPYGALVIPHLAEAAGIYHANPQIVYVPHQRVLGDYNTEYAEGLYLFEERPGGVTNVHDDYGNTEKTVNTLKLLKTLSNKGHKHVVDQEWVLKSRLFDILIGDWDRHDDQWRWGTYEDGDKTIYRPIPRDRDQVFFKNDGILDFIASRPYFSPQLRKFDSDIDFLYGVIFNARHFDRSFINKLSREQFISIAQQLQTAMTDEVITEAFNAWPESLKNLNGDEIIGKLKSRRDKIVEYAGAFHDYIFKEVAITGTNSRNTFTVEFLANNKLNVTVSHKDDNDLLYDGMIDGNITNELRLFGLKKDDKFILKGPNTNSTKIIIVGGSGEDTIENTTNNRVEVHDRPEGVSVEGRHKSKISDEKDVTGYNRKDWKQNRLIHFPILSFYTDEGLGLAYNVWWINQGFRSSPFKSSHNLSFGYFPKNSAFVANYRGIFPEAIGNADFELDIEGVGPAFTQFFYGLGNDYINFGEQFSEIESASSTTFHIVRGTHIDVNPRIVTKLNSSSSFTINPSIEFMRLSEGDDDPRFFLLPEANIDAVDFESALYVGVGVNYEIHRIDSPTFPNRGFIFNVNSDYKLNLNNSEFSNLTLGSELITYIPFSQSNKVVLAMNMGATYTIGETQFFHANYLSNASRLRGFKTNRFGGEGIVYHATDLRLQIFEGKGSVPVTIGVFGSFDYGKAFFDEDDFDDTSLHTSVGGGLYFSPLSLASFRVGYFVGDEDTQITLGGSLAF